MTLRAFSINELLPEWGEEDVSSSLSSFRCSKNSDIEDFARRKALDFCKQGIAVTYLVFSYGDDKAFLAGFYTLAFKIATVPQDVLSNSVVRKLSKFSEHDAREGCYKVPSILIAQFGKNDEFSSLVSGSEMMKLALDSAREIQARVGGRFVFLECENKPKLLAFYEGEGFQQFGLRSLEPDDESAELHELVQLFKFVRN